MLQLQEAALAEEQLPSSGCAAGAAAGSKEVDRWRSKASVWIRRAVVVFFLVVIIVVMKSSAAVQLWI